MIYFDAAATTLQKPAAVRQAVARALELCANPGRSGHKPALRAAEEVFACREEAAAFFGMEAPERVVFTQNATHALNLAIKSLLHDGGHAVISGYEHNSVVRPLEAMARQGVTYTAAYSSLFQPQETLDAIRAAIVPETRCVILNHVSNVFGFVLPLEEVDALCAEQGLPLIVDASQSAGVLPLKASALRAADFLCMPGHKALYGPQGTGLLLCCKDIQPYSLIEGGTGSLSLEARQPDFLPDLLESGTLNVPGIAGLREGLRFAAKNREEICRREQDLVRRLAEGIGALKGTEVFSHPDCQSGVLSFRSTRHDPAQLAEALGERGVCVRSGLHCAPLAHRSADTLPAGTVRLSLSAFNTGREAEGFLRILKDLLKTP